VLISSGRFIVQASERTFSQIDEVHRSEPASTPAALDSIPDIKCNI